MIKTRIIKVKSIENVKIIMAITLTKMIIMKNTVIIVIIMIMRIKIGNQIKISNVKIK